MIRYEGPKGSPGMPEMLSPGAALVGSGLGKEVALVTDGRFSGALTTREPKHAWRGAASLVGRAGLLHVACRSSQWPRRGPCLHRWLASIGASVVLVSRLVPAAVLAPVPAPTCT